MLLDTVPSNIYKGQKISFVMDTLSAHRSYIVKDDEWAIHDIRIGNTLMDYSETVTQKTRIEGYREEPLKALVGDQAPGIHDPKILSKSGYQANTPLSLHCNFKGDECWRTKTHPMISAISKSGGLTSGGQLLEIEGHGLNGKNVQV